MESRINVNVGVRLSAPMTPLYELKQLLCSSKFFLFLFVGHKVVSLNTGVMMIRNAPNQATVNKHQPTC